MIYACVDITRNKIKFYFAHARFAVINAEGPRSHRARSDEDFRERERATMSETPGDMVAWFQQVVKEHSAVCLVYYRGRW